jgi:hypothetical protein
VNKYNNINMMGSQKVPRILWHWQFGASGVRTAWTELLVTSASKFCRGSGSTSGRQGQWFLYRATHHPATAVSGSRSEWRLAVPYCENEPLGDTFPNHGVRQMEWDGRTPEDSKRSLPPVLPTRAWSMEQVCELRYILIHILICSKWCILMKHN